MLCLLLFTPNCFLIFSRRSEKVNGEEKRKGGFNKPCALSPQLQKLVGEPELGRPEVMLNLYGVLLLWSSLCFWSNSYISFGDVFLLVGRQEDLGLYPGEEITKPTEQAENFMWWCFEWNFSGQSNRHVPDEQGAIQAYLAHRWERW